MTELYTRLKSNEAWTLAAWVQDAEAARLAKDLRAEGFQVSLVTRHREIDDWSSERLFPLMP